MAAWLSYFCYAWDKIWNSCPPTFPQSVLQQTSKTRGQAESKRQHVVPFQSPSSFKAELWSLESQGSTASSVLFLLQYQREQNIPKWDPCSKWDFPPGLGLFEAACVKACWGYAWVWGVAAQVCFALVFFGWRLNQRWLWLGGEFRAPNTGGCADAFLGSPGICRVH